MMASIRRAAHLLATASSFFSFFLGAIVLSYAVLPIAWLLGGGRAARARRCRRVVSRTWVLFHDYMRVLALIDYDPRAVRLRLPRGPCILIANHPTLVDVTALAAAVPDLVFVAKQAMFRNPVVGPLLRLCRHIPGGDGSPFGGAAVVEQTLDRLRDGAPVLIFPEGTRSPARGLHPFRPGAFRIATQAGVEIVPVVITCDPPTLLKGQAWYAIPKERATLRVCRLLDTPLRDPPRDAATLLQESYAAYLGGGGRACVASGSRLDPAPAPLHDAPL